MPLTGPSFAAVIDKCNGLPAAVMKEAEAAIKIMHTRGFVHCDIRWANLLCYRGHIVWMTTMHTSPTAGGRQAMMKKRSSNIFDIIES